MAANNNNQEDVEQTLLTYLDKEGSVKDSGIWAAQHKWEHNDTLIGAFKRLVAFDIIALDIIEHRALNITQDGADALKNGSPEARVYNSIPADGISKADLDAAVGPAAKLGHGEAMKNKWIRIDKEKGGKIFKNLDSITDSVKVLLEKVAAKTELSADEVKTLKGRRMVQEGVVKTFAITKGAKFTPVFKKAAADLTAEMLASGSWKEETFKDYNFNALGVKPKSGYLHPLMKVRAEIREIFLGMGFEEMETSNYVESSFWNFDALFQPQQHPARDAHDTFFLKNPASATHIPADYAELVKKTHEDGGGYGSIGWRYDWSMDEAKKNILRTHTTAVSTRMLYQLAKNGFKPSKYFSIDRVFRNETLDATHLAEFHQIEGLIADYNITLSNLIGVIQQFFNRLGIPDVRFKPAFNPYTEPSMEIFGYHPLLKRWVELGNSGMFRPEMLLPMGLPKDVRVIAWGLSLERPTMIKYGIDNIRDIFGPKVDLSYVENNPICYIQDASDKQ